MDEPEEKPNQFTGEVLSLKYKRNILKPVNKNNAFGSMQRLSMVDNNLINNTNKIMSGSPERSSKFQSMSMSAIGFSIRQGKTIPDMKEERKEQRTLKMETLLERPSHKESVNNEATSQYKHDFSKVPLSMEDKDCFSNLPLIYTLR